MTSDSKNTALNEEAMLLNQRAQTRKKMLNIGQYVLAILVTLVMFFPLYWMLITSVKSQQEVLRSLPTFWPREWHFENYANVFKRANFSKYYYNTTVMTVGILFSQVITGVLAGYGFSKGIFKGILLMIRWMIDFILET